MVSDAQFIDRYLETRSIIKTGSIYELSETEHLCRRVGLLSDAIEIGRELVRSHPRMAEIHANLAASYSSASQYKNAQLHFSRAVELSGAAVSHLRNQGVNFADQGFDDLAEQTLMKAFEAGPHDAKTIRVMCARIKDLDTEYALGLIKKAQRHATTDSDCSELFWAQYCIYNKQKDYKVAYKYLTKANGLRNKISGYTMDKEIDFRRTIGEIFESRQILDYTKLPRGDLVSENLAPIFIVGMPRSGSTVLEKVLQHYFGLPSISEVETGRSAMHAVKIGIPVSTAIENARDIYFRGINRLIPNEQQIFIDKSLFNFRYLGLLLICFPNSRVLITKRSKSDIVWSNYVQYFSGSELGYSFDFNLIIRFYNLVEDYLEFWSALFPDRILVVENKNLVRNSKKIASQVQDLLSVDCPFVTSSDYVGATSPSSTASSAQIREKLRVFPSAFNHYSKLIPKGILENL